MLVYKQHHHSIKYSDDRCYGTPLHNNAPISRYFHRFILLDASEQNGIISPFSRNVTMTTEIIGEKSLFLLGCLSRHISVKQFLYVLFFHRHVILFISCNNLCRALDIMPRHEDSLVPSTCAISAKLISSFSRISTIFLHL